MAKATTHNDFVVRTQTLQPIATKGPANPVINEYENHPCFFFSSTR